VSKAFTRESDDDAERPIARPRSALPPGAKNYLTPDGERRLRAESGRLLQVERPALARATGGGENAQRLAAIDRRLREIEESLATAIVVPTPPQPWDKVLFGAMVSVRDDTGEADEYRIVGVDEVDLDRGWVSYLSPIARALLNAPRGGRVKFRFPSGEKELEILEIRYQS
jgi:transcription elongation factor GreB